MGSPVLSDSAQEGLESAIIICRQVLNELPWLYLMTSLNKSVHPFVVSICIYSSALGRPSEQSYLAPDLLLSADNYPTVLGGGGQRHDVKKFKTNPQRSRSSSVKD